MSADSLPPPSGASASGDTAKRVVVGVVGIGHVPGILENWGKVTKEQIRFVLSSHLFLPFFHAGSVCLSV